MKHSLLLLFIIASSTCVAQVIPFSTNDEGYIIVSAKFNDSVDAKLVFDTGGGINVVSNNFFQKIKRGAQFQHYYTGFRHDGDRIDVEVYQVPSLNIGSFELKNVMVGVTAILDGWNMDGIISLINFEKTPVTVDYNKKKLIIETPTSLHKKARSAQTLPIKLHQFGNLSLDIFVPVCINGSTSLDMEFDTGSLPEDVIVNSKFLDVLRIDTSKTRNETIFTPFTSTSLRRYITTIDSVQYCSLIYPSLKNIRVDFKQNLIYDGIIGAGYFRELSFTIDIPNKRILVKRGE